MSERARNMAAALPRYMPNYPGSGNYTFFEVVADELDEVEGVIDEISDAVQIQTARTLGQLAWHGRMYNVFPREGETADHYRARILAETQLNAYQATADDMMEYLSAVMDVDNEEFVFDPLTDDNTKIQIRVPAYVLSQRAFTVSDLNDIIRRAGTAAGTIDVVEGGSLGYITPSEHGVTPYSNDGYDSLETDVAQSFTAATLPTGWTLGGTATYDDVNDRVQLNSGTGSTSGNVVYDAGVGGITNWTVGGDMYVDGGGDEFVVNFYSDSPGTGAHPTNGYQVKYDHLNDTIELHDVTAAADLATASVTIPETAATNTFRVEYFNGQVRVYLNGVGYINHTLAAPSYTYDGLSFGGWDSATTGLHALADFEFVGGVPTGSGAGYSGLSDN